MGIKRGIIQSRGLGDILIALPIARYYYDQGDEIHWPVCEEFYASVVDSVPWVTWYKVPTDKEGSFFLETPLRLLAEAGVKEEMLYLYHYLNVAPERTDPELFNILKFDQYKYWKSSVPFRLKWRLDQCITRDPVQERTLREDLGIQEGDRYAVTSLKGSNFQVNVTPTWLDPALRLIDVDLNQTDSIFDWIGVLAGAEAVVCVDSAIANMVDQLCIEGPELYWIRRSPWDLTPVLGSQWTIVPTNLPITEPTRVDPAAAAAAKRADQARVKAAASAASGLTSHVPFDVNRTGYPTSFMSALKK